MNSLVCVDASFTVKLVVEEPDSHLADQLWESWIRENARIVAPSLMYYEIAAVLRKKVYRGLLSEGKARMALSAALNLEVDLVTLSRLHLRAWEVACRFNLPTAYDAHYLALAEMERCEFWTADERLYDSVRDQFPLIRCLGQPKEPV